MLSTGYWFNQRIALTNVWTTEGWSIFRLRPTIWTPGTRINVLRPNKSEIYELVISSSANHVQWSFPFYSIITDDYIFQSFSHVATSRFKMVEWERRSSLKLITVLAYIDHHKTRSTRYKEYLRSINILPGIMFKNLARIGEKTITKLGPWRIVAIRHLRMVISYMMYRSPWLEIPRPDSAGS